MFLFCFAFFFSLGIDRRYDITAFLLGKGAFGIYHSKPTLHCAATNPPHTCEGQVSWAQTLPSIPCVLAESVPLLFLQTES